MSQSLNVLLTGGTGFLGEYLMAELLERGHKVWALFRSDSKKLDTIRFLGSLGLPRSANSLHWVKGEILDIDEHWEDWCKESENLENVDTVIHSAASTRLHMDECGDPLRTNLGSAQALKKLYLRKPLTVHIISTAYVCGLVQGDIVKEVNHPRGDFLNVYEESKWESENIWQGHATFLRPSIILGHSETARCTSFSGWYILFQAAHLLDRLMQDPSSRERFELGIDIPAEPLATTNVIPVDYVAKSVIRIIENPANHKKIFHLTHPDPPNHEWTLDLVCRRFNLGGLKFVGAGAPFMQPRNRIERMAWRQMQTILLHFANNPIFDRTNTSHAVPELAVPPITEDFVNRLIDYAIEKGWGLA
jgi:nucleoside-diphosphate-sugar epimerase